MVSDSIGDMLTRIRNAGMAHLETTEIPLSKMKLRLAEILRDAGYISDFRVEEGIPGKIRVMLKYGKLRRSAISGLKRVSRPGRRVYVGHEAIPQVYSGMGIAILTTSRGVMTDRQARRDGIGGELLCEVW